MIGSLAYNKLEMICKKAVVAGFKSLSWNFPGETEENNEKPVRTATGPNFKPRAYGKRSKS